MAVATTGNRKAILLGVLAVLVLAAAAVLWWFQPQKLFSDDKEDEAFPGPAAPSASSAPPQQQAPSQAVVLGQGDFRGLSHRSSGRALLVDLPGSVRTLRFENLKTDNGPDLRVYLSRAPAEGPEQALDDDFVDLGALKGNVGSQNYALPATVDVTKYRSTVIWCRRFRAGFAVASLVP